MEHSCNLYACTELTRGSWCTIFSGNFCDGDISAYIGIEQKLVYKIFIMRNNIHSVCVQIIHQDIATLLFFFMYNFWDTDISIFILWNYKWNYFFVYAFFFRDISHYLMNGTLTNFILKYALSKISFNKRPLKDATMHFKLM